MNKNTGNRGKSPKKRASPPFNKKAKTALNLVSATVCVSLVGCSSGGLLNTEQAAKDDTLRKVASSCGKFVEPVKVNDTASTACVPTRFEFDELIAMSKPDFLERKGEKNSDEKTREIREHLAVVVNTPVVKNFPSTKAPAKIHSGYGNYFRASEWNINEGLEYDLVEMALTDGDRFADTNLDPKKVKSDEAGKIRRQLRDFADSDVLFINEIDRGVCRSDYRDEPEDLAKKLGMNYAFTVEAVEVDPQALGLEKTGPGRTCMKGKEIQEVDRDRSLNLHGNAIFSKFPIVRAKRIALTVAKNAETGETYECHDWYEDEISRSDLQKAIDKGIKTLFKEDNPRQLRRGGRHAQLVEIAAPGGNVILLNTHMENKTSPKCRRRQMDLILGELKAYQAEYGVMPIILGGDLNTHQKDGTPRTVGRELTKRILNLDFAGSQVIKYTVPYGGWGLLARDGFNLPRTSKNPAAKDIPFLLSNAEGKLFSDLDKFKFFKSGKFALGGSAGAWGSSNQRDGLGFSSTHKANRSFGPLGPIIGAEGRLDWFFVKPTAERKCFLPHDAETLKFMNEKVLVEPSDHRPIMMNVQLDCDPQSGADADDKDSSEESSEKRN